MHNLPRAIKVLLAILLLLCLADMPYGYFQFVAYGSKKMGETILFCAFCLLFQPFEKIALGRFLWNVVDFVLALYLVGSAVIYTTTKKS